MNKRTILASVAILLVFAAAYVTGARAQNAGGVQPSAPAGGRSQQACENVDNFFTTDCPLTWRGITVYGTIDMGATWQSYGTATSKKLPAGNEYLLSKNADHSQWNWAPNALSQSAIGLRGNEEFAPDWAFIFDLEAGFNPYSLELANGPGSLKDNQGVPLNQQDSNGDSSRAGQIYNSQGYLGVSSSKYGTLTVFRQNALTLDGVSAYDPLGGSYAFSPIGYQGTACGAGDTEDCRFTTAAKYRVNAGPFRAAALWQFGGYSMENASDGAYQLQAGGDIPNVGGGTVSLDGIFSYVRDAVSLSLSGNTLPSMLPQVLTATISNDTSWMALARYTKGRAKLFGGYEWIRYAPPSDPQASFNDIAGDLICAGCSAVNGTSINNTAFSANDKILQIFWLGTRYAVTDEWTVMAGYYEYLQNSYGAGADCSDSSKATCSGTYHAVSLAGDWQFSAKFDAYAGIMYQKADAGLANGFLHRTTVDPAIGVRFRF